MDLPRLLMRRALAVALGCLALALLLGLLRVRSDTRQEMQGSLALAGVGEVLARLPALDDAAALAALRRLDGLRHLRLELRDAAGAPLLRLPDDRAALADAGVGAALARLLGGAAAPAPVSWSVPRADGGPWTAVLTASPDSELQEALASFGGLFVLLAGGSALMLAVLHWNLRRSLQPLQALLGAIAHVERQDLAAVRALPPMPIRELEALAQALRHLAAAQERAESDRRVLGHRLLSLQEDERQRLARDLHDEFGQRLTGLRVDAAWLKRRLQPWPELQAVATGMGEQVALIQDDLRRLLDRLRPFAPAEPGQPPAPCTLGRLRLMLEDLVAGWSASAQGRRTRFALQVDARDDAASLPQALVLGVYRISQEALTNVARHAEAGQATLAVRLARGAEGARVLAWSVQDDGRGMAGLAAARQRGSGLAGIQDRVWTLGGELEAGPDAGGAGLTLCARLPVDAVAGPQGR